MRMKQKETATQLMNRNPTKFIDSDGGEIIGIISTNDSIEVVPVKGIGFVVIILKNGAGMMGGMNNLMSPMSVTVYLMRAETFFNIFKVRNTKLKKSVFCNIAIPKYSTHTLPH